MTTPTISVVIPTLNAGGDLPRLLCGLQRQRLAACEILVIDSASVDGTAERAEQLGARVHRISRQNFNHGGTRNLGVTLTRGSVVVFLTQDADVYTEDFLETLCQPLADGRAAAAFAQQQPHAHAWPPERLARAWNYPEADEWRQQKDASGWGLRLVFFSNVASAVRRDRFLAVGGFPETVIMNEDVVLCARLLAAGDTVAYLAQAKVRHSHNYSLAQQFRRYFDIGVFHARHAALIPAVGTSGEGLRFLKRQIVGLVRGGDWQWIPRTCADVVARFIAFHLGKREHLLGRSLKRRLSMHRGYWGKSHGSQ